MITFKKLLKCYNDDLEKQGIYNKQKALKSLLNDILEGYKDIQEAKDNLVIMQKNNAILTVLTDRNIKLLKQQNRIKGFSEIEGAKSFASFAFQEIYKIINDKN